MTAALSGKNNGNQAAILVNASEVFSVDSSGMDSPVSISATASAGALTVSLVKGGWRFRSPTLTNGQPTYVKTDTDLSITVPAASNLGRLVNNGVNNLIALVANSGGTPVLCLVNIAGGVSLDETNLTSPTTISGASSSATVVYSSGAVAANSPYRVVGQVNTVFTDGTGWANPTLVQPFMGNALDALQSLGYGQTQQDVTGSRVLGTTYYNTTGRPIHVQIRGVSPAGSTGGVGLTINGVAMPFSSQISSNPTYTGGIVPPGGSYSATAGGGSLGSWVELR
jgi:hypothetical protein